MNFKNWSFSLLLILTIFSGCVNNRVLPAHDETLLYPLAYDLVFMRTLDAVQSLPEWELEETEKENGIITVHNTKFGAMTDADKRAVAFKITRVNRNQTSIQIMPQTQHVIGGEKLLEQIAKFMSLEIKK